MVPRRNLMSTEYMSKRAIPARDVWFLCVIVESSCQIGRMVGTPLSPPLSPSPRPPYLFYKSIKFVFQYS